MNRVSNEYNTRINDFLFCQCASTLSTFSERGRRGTKASSLTDQQFMGVLQLLTHIYRVSLTGAL